MKSITLFIDGEDKTFTTPFVNGLVWRKWVELQAKAEDLNHLTLEELDAFVSLVVMAYNNQFTLEQFYQGTPFDQVITRVEELFQSPSNEEEIKKK